MCAHPACTAVPSPPVLPKRRWGKFLVRTKPAPLHPTLAALGGSPAARPRQRPPRPRNGSQVLARCTQPLASAQGQDAAHRLRVPPAWSDAVSRGHGSAASNHRTGSRTTMLGAQHGVVPPGQQLSASGSHLPSFQHHRQAVLIARLCQAAFLRMHPQQMYIG